eukprot:COSAG05_NODE_9240_length_637_cov_1.122677_3_plen_20_part_01
MFRLILDQILLTVTFGTVSR